MKIVYWIMLILFSAFMFRAYFKLHDITVAKNGEIISMKIEKLPESCLGTKAKYFMTLSYQGTKYIKQIGANYCDHHYVGEMVQMKYLEGYTLVLFPSETGKTNLYSLLAIAVFGIGTIIYLGRRNR